MDKEWSGDPGLFFACCGLGGRRQEEVPDLVEHLQTKGMQFYSRGIEKIKDTRAM